MKFFCNQRRMYLLAIALVALAVLLVCCSGWGRGGGQEAPTVAPTLASTLDPTRSPIVLPAAVTPSPTEEQKRTSDAGEETMTTVVYYQDNYGYLVPVAKKIPLEDGVAKATLGRMVKSLANDMEAARLGLKTVLPEGTRIDLDIPSDKIARIDLSDAVTKLDSAQSESVMVSAIVQTLTEFESVDAVRITVEGQALEKLPNGTAISGDMTRRGVNIESTSLEENAGETVRLYFPSEDGALLVPVTRMVYGAGDINTAVLELAKGPRASGQLENALPSGVGLIGVKVQDGVAIVNFTKDFIEIVEQSDGGRLALRALMLTCSQFEGVGGVKVLVEGEDYDPGLDTMSIPTFINDADSVIDQAIATQSSEIFE